MVSFDNRYFEAVDFGKYCKSRVKKARLIAAVLKDYLPPKDGLIVDVGGGTGIVAAEIARILERDVIVLEPDKALLANSKQSNAAVIGDLKELPFREGSIDLLIVNHVWEHLATPEKCLDQVAKVLKPNGIVYLTLGNRLWLIEPHYKLPFLSWLPKKLANKYLSTVHPGQSYDGINFPAPWQLFKWLKHPLLHWEDVTWHVLRKQRNLLDKWWWRRSLGCLTVMPTLLMRPLWFYVTPQWFLIARKS